MKVQEFFKAVHRLPETYLLRGVFWLVAILLGALQIWANRYSIWLDAVSYLDIGDAYFQGDWNAAINACWSPLYSWLLGLALFIFKPAPAQEILVVKFVNFLIYLFALICFEFFLTELIRLYKKNIPQNDPDRFLSIPDWVWWTAGYILFLWSALRWLVVYREAPDTVVAALVYLAAGILLQIAQSQIWFNFAALGTVLGLSYLAKSSMFPLAFVFLTVSLFSGDRLRRSLPRVLVGLLIFFLISTPFITALSSQKNRLTFGDAGKLNYAWYVSPKVRDTHWQGFPKGSGVPQHPTRKIFSKPDAFEFATPVSGTFPPWYDPSYWNEGLQPTFNISKQFSFIFRNTIFCFKLFLASLIFSYLILICASGRLPLALADLWQNWRNLVPAIVGLGGFVTLTDISWKSDLWGYGQTRYIAPFVVLLFAGVFSSIRLPNSRWSKQLVVVLTIATLCLSGGRLVYEASKDVATIARGSEHIHWQIASRLHQLGIQPGDNVAALGEENNYWARLTGVKIVASIPGVNGFWSTSPEVKTEVLAALRKTGARAIVQQPNLMKVSDAGALGWQSIENTEAYVYLLK